MEENASKKLREIDEQIAAYFRARAKARWPEIEQHWKNQKASREALVEKLKLWLTEEELSIFLGIVK